MDRQSSSTADLDVDLGRLFGSLARRWKRVLAVTLCVALAAFVLASLATPQYRAESRLIIESRESVFTRPDSQSASGDPLFDQEAVTSQVEVISSNEILTQIARRFDLASRPEFRKAVNPSWASHLLVLTGLKTDPAVIPPEERVLAAFRERLSIYRVENSRVIVIQFSSEDPKLAADVPNAIADAYLSLQRDAKLASNSDATAWLAPEIKTLTEKVKD
ncbi:MAG: chain-length determining protein, partial [Methylobacterium mesophilicum]|nr:chain-length determining protein [Methylobacterium mesophilicum]